MRDIILFYLLLTGALASGCGHQLQVSGNLQPDLHLSPAGEAGQVLPGRAPILWYVHNGYVKMFVVFLCSVIVVILFN